MEIPSSSSSSSDTGSTPGSSTPPTSKPGPTIVDELLGKLTELKARTLAFYTDPSGAWQGIKSEPLTVSDIYKRYAVYTAGIPAVCGFLGLWLVGVNVPFMGRVSYSFFGGLIGQALYFGFSLLMVYVSAWILQKLAPKFGGSSDVASCLKLMVFTALPSMWAGILTIWPGMLASLVGFIVGCWAFYIFWKGVPILTGVVQKKILYLITVVLCMIIPAIVGAFVLQAVSPGPRVAAQG